MGLDYSYEILLPTENVAGALLELTKLAPPTRAVPPLTVTLPGGDELVLPFTSHFESEPVDCSTTGRLQLDTSIMFAVDDVVDKFDSGAARDELGRIQIGYIYLTVRFAPAPHPRFASMGFMAATTGMSLLFEQSESVRTVFTDLAAASGGVCCLLDTESDVLQVCWLNGRPVRDTVPGPRFAHYRDLVASWPGQDE
ncbi:hypothetical protein [Streptomyces fructofermentans]|uniref:Uncharacterized protein n=1 Tax=Streptomyces fructofermentans TaxID=152141 RepID=A0A918NN64_9ACTN|nr:hypothetical protein [Streptomyces fructofermentans]GGX82749.1 hypothetical protein GCM10010515_57920 [Streptomyces fructofermentans]